MPRVEWIRGPVERRQGRETTVCLDLPPAETHLYGNSRDSAVATAARRPHRRVRRGCGEEEHAERDGDRGVAGGTETIPPLDAYATRTPPNPKQGTTVETIESYVTAAEQSGGGWVQLVFHHLCNQCDAYSISPGDLTALLDWLQPRTANGTVVKTTAEVIGGPVQPPVQP